MVWRLLGRREVRASSGDPHAHARDRMVAEQIESRGLRDPELLRALRTVPRHLFVDSRHAYDDRALAVGEGQTISQPYMVAVMTDAARPAGGWRGAKVLEIGTGSGYQAAILAELGADVTTIERHPALAATAADRLATHDYGSVRVIVGDGSGGHADGAPYDSIIVTAAGPLVPRPLLDQLSPTGGRLVMPVGSRDHQVMTVVTREGNATTVRELDACVFVPLLGTFGFRSSGNGR